MAISTDFNYDNLLSLEKAKLVSRERQNFLDTKELVLDYHQITSAAKEDAVEWLQTSTGSGGGGRLTLVDPKFSFKTYEGTWTCVSISYNEDAKVIRQVFKIDSTIGDLGDVDVEADFGEQSGDISRISDGMEVQRAYYWRITNPERIVLPSSPRVGEIWSKTANDNGDGTYDVIVTREIAENLTAGSSVDTDLFTEVSETNTNSVEISFASDSYGDNSVADAVFREVKRVDNVPLENGKFRSTVTTRTSIADKQSFAFPSDYSQVGGQLVVARNQPFSELALDIAVVNPSPWVYILSISLSPNDDGTYDYNISAHI